MIVCIVGMNVCLILDVRFFFLISTNNTTTKVEDAEKQPNARKRTGNVDRGGV
jgi:phosphotransferase system  glucose/maltose/N-acetylglucosamine-specific IIC component